MTLQRQIEEINDPQLFSELCIALLEAEYGADYQTVDDNRSDAGNDGYLISEKRMFARHAFKKTEASRKDSDKRKKLNGDFVKAVKLSENSNYDIERWTFLTNYPLSNQLIEEARALGKHHHIEINHQGASYLAGLLAKHPHILPLFPQLEQPMIAKDIQQISKEVGELKTLVTDTRGTKVTPESGQPLAAPEASIPENPIPPSEPPKSDKQLDLVIRISSLEPTKENKKKLHAIVYSSSSRFAQIQAVLALSSWHDPQTESATSMASLCDLGIQIAHELGAKRELAVLTGQKAQYLGQELVVEEIGLWGDIQMNRTLGMTITSHTEIEKRRKRVLALDQERRNTTATAFDLAKEANDLEAYSHVLLYAGQTAGQLGSVLGNMGDEKTAQAQMQLSKKLLILAKNLFEKMGDAQGRAYALHNLANQLRFFGEEDVALEIANQVVTDARTLKDKKLEANAKELIKQIKNPRK